MKAGIKNIFIIFILSLQYSLSKGQTWSSLGQGLKAAVYSLAADTLNNLIYAGGAFRYLDQNSNDTMAYIGKWDGDNWLRVGNGDELVGGLVGVSAMMFHNNELYIGGDISCLGSLTVGKWENLNWYSLDLGFNDSPGGCGAFATVYDFAFFNNSVVAGGCFKIIRDFIPANWDTVNGIAQWNGISWDSLGSGVFDSSGGFYSVIYDLEVYNGELYAAGYFESAGGVTVQNIAKWNGTQWLSVGFGAPQFTKTLCVYNGALYLGGGSNKIFQWDGTNWDTIATLSGTTDEQIFCLEVYQNQLVAGGEFNTINGIPANNIAKWDGVNWSPLGAGTGGIFGRRVESLAVLNNELYVGGLFETAGGIQVNHIAKWGGCGPYIAFSKNKDTVNLSVSGQITFTNNSTGFDSLLWDFGDGATDTAKNPTHIYDSIGNYTVTLTGFKDTCSSSTTSPVTVIQSTAIPTNQLQDEIKIYSNPFNKILEIEFETPSTANLQLTIYNFTGKEINRVERKQLPKGTHTEQINTENLSSGLYFLIANINGQIKTMKIIKM